MHTEKLSPRTIGKEISKGISIFFQTAIINYLRLHWRLSTILGTSNKSAWGNGFWYVKVCIFWKCVQYTIHWDKTKILKIFPSDKINATKNVLSFLSGAPTHHSFIFNLWFLYGLKHKVRVSKAVGGVSNFSIPFRFH